MNTNVYEEKQVQEAFEDLMKYCNRSERKESELLLNKAFIFAANAHHGVKRKSGEPYILHPIAVAKIVAKEIGLGTKAVSAALLHDVVEDTQYTVEDIDNIFGSKIAYMVDGLTKIGGIFDLGVSQQAENFKKMLLTLSDDMRVILVKIADRLHNMRTLEHMPPNKQMKIASETLYVFAPLAHRLGLRNIRKDLESLSLRYKNPGEYKAIEYKLSESQAKVDCMLDNFINPIQQRLDEKSYDYSIKGRRKSIFSIWRKMQKKGLSFEEIYDKLAVRIVFEPKSGLSESAQCWEIFSIISKLYLRKEDRIRDWISQPRPTGYEALHLTVMADSGDWVEVQIRSRRMHDIAERGVAVHWSYKESNSEVNNKITELDQWLTEIRVLFENPDSDALSFLDDFKLGLYYNDIQVVTPKGDVHTMPKGATVLDFAYRIHTELGNHCIGGKVNRKTQPVNCVLKSADQVEVLTSEKQKPQEEWLNIVVTPRAKSILKSTFRAERRKKIEEGKELLNHYFSRNKFNAINENSLHKLLQVMKIAKKEQLYIDIANGIILEKDIKKYYSKIVGNASWISYATVKITNPFKRKKELIDTPSNKVKPFINNKIDKKKTLALRDDKVDDEYSIAECCNPIPGDKVIAYYDLEEKIQIHKRTCPRIVHISSLQGDRLLSADWETHRKKSFLAVVNVEGIDRHGLLNDITNIVSNDYDVNMQGLSMESNNGIFTGEIKLYVHHVSDLNELIAKLIAIDGTTSIRRKESI